MQRRTLVDNKWVKLYEDKFNLSNGSECTYYHAQKCDAVMAIAIETGLSGFETYIVSQHRHPINQSIWQFPMGGFDSSIQEPIEAGKRELLEETGVEVGEMSYLGSYYADPGFTSQKVHVCATRDIKGIGAQNLELTEHGLKCKKIQIADISSMIESGEMGDAWGIAGFYYASKYCESLM